MSRATYVDRVCAAWARRASEPERAKAFLQGVRDRRDALTLAGCEALATGDDEGLDLVSAARRLDEALERCRRAAAALAG